MPPRQRERSGKFKKTKFGADWYTGGHYKTGQNFSTFLRNSPLNIDKVAQEVKKLVGTPSQTTALEVGPGAHPLIAGLGFKRTYFMDQSKVVASSLKDREVFVRVTRRNLHKFENSVDYSHLQRDVERGLLAHHPVEFNKTDRRKHQIVIGDLGRLPFSDGALFGVVVLSEVLTHIRPAQRLKVIERIAGISKSILIVDRPQIGLSGLREEKVLQFKEHSDKGPRLPLPPQEIAKISEKLFNSATRTRAQLRAEQATLVNFQRLTNFLKRKGWTVETVPLMTDGKRVSYMMLKARK